MSDHILCLKCWLAELPCKKQLERMTFNGTYLFRPSFLCFLSEGDCGLAYTFYPEEGKIIRSEVRAAFQIKEAFLS